MLVKDLIEDLKSMDPTAAVGFVGNGTWAAKGIRYGRVEGQSQGYVLLVAGAITAEEHDPPREG